MTTNHYKMDTGKSWNPSPTDLELGFGWALDAGRQVLALGNPTTGRWAYELRLDHCTTWSDLLFWIERVGWQPWASGEVMAGLVNALKESGALKRALAGEV